MSVTPPVPSPKPAGSVNVATIVADIVKYAGPAIAALTAVENIPGIGVSGPAQGAIAGVVAVLTAVLSVLTQSNKVAGVGAPKAAK
jgi:hypothetical protein